MHNAQKSNVNRRRDCDFVSVTMEVTRETIPDHVLSHILSFCDLSDHISVLEASKPFFSKAIQLYLSSTSSLSLSFLLKKFSNSVTDHSRQENAVGTLLSSSIQSAKKANRTVKWKRIEFSNLRSVTGESFLLALKDVPLIKIDFTNCIRLDPQLLLEYLRYCPTTLKYLSLNGCTQVGSDVVETVMERHTQLTTLSLGSCSQSLRADSCLSKLPQFHQLRHLDLRCLKHISDESISLVDLLPTSLRSIDLSGCEQLRMLSREAQRKMQVYLERSQQYVEAAEVRIANINNILENNVDNNGNARAVYPGILQDNPEVFIWKDEPTSRHRLRHLFLDGVANPRRGLCRGMVAYFAHGRCLQEVHLAGCENVGDWEIAALAVTCGDTLTCFQMRAGKIGNLALKALARHCHVLGEIDVSACFGVSDAGVIALCGHTRDRRQRQSEVESRSPDRKRRRLVRSSLKALKVASLPQLTDRGIEAIANLRSLLVLDVHDCPEVTPPAIQKTLHALLDLIDVNAKDIGTGSGVSLPTLLRNDRSAPRNLKFVNQRKFVSSVDRELDTSSSSPSPSSGCGLKSCCTVHSQSQRLSNAVPLQMMYHCSDCQLIPSLDRGMCQNCAVTCHKGHKTFLGSYTRFYCDCPFGLTAERDCQAIVTTCNNVEVEAS